MEKFRLYHRLKGETHTNLINYTPVNYWGFFLVDEQLTIWYSVYMSLYIVRKNKKDCKEDIEVVKNLCKKLHMSFPGDLIIDMLYLPKQNAWTRWRNIL